MSATWVGSPTLHSITRAPERPLATRSASARLRPSGSATELPTQRAPPCPSAVTMPAPMPRELPVTRATLPVKLNKLLMGCSMNRVAALVSSRAVREVQIKDLHMPVRKLVPELDGEVPKHMNSDTPTCGIVFDVVGEVGRKCRDLTEPVE